MISAFLMNEINVARTMRRFLKVGTILYIETFSAYTKQKQISHLLNSNAAMPTTFVANEINDGTNNL